MNMNLTSNVFLWVMTALYFLAALQDFIFGDKNRAGVFLGYGFSNIFLMRLGHG